MQKARFIKYTMYIFLFLKRKNLLICILHFMIFYMRKSNWKKILILKKLIRTHKIHLETSISVSRLDYHYDKYIVIYYKVIYYRYSSLNSEFCTVIILSTEKQLHDLHFLKTKLILCAGVVVLCISRHKWRYNNLVSASDNVHNVR